MSEEKDTEVKGGCLGLTTLLIGLFAIGYAIYVLATV